MFSKKGNEKANIITPPTNFNLALLYNNARHINKIAKVTNHDLPLKALE